MGEKYIIFMALHAFKSLIQKVEKGIFSDFISYNFPYKKLPEKWRKIRTFEGNELRNRRLSGIIYKKNRGGSQ